MATTRTMQDQDLVAKSENLCLQNSAGSETWKATGRDPVYATIQCVRTFW